MNSRSVGIATDVSCIGHNFGIFEMFTDNDMVVH